MLSLITGKSSQALGAFGPAVSASLFLCLGLVAAFYLATEAFKPVGLRKGQKGQVAKLPPGPKGVPIFGSLLEMRADRANPDRKLLQDAPALYGEMTSLHLGEKTVVLLNSARVCQEIIAKRGSATSDRSPMPVASGLVSRDGKQLILPRGPWTERRRVMHNILGSMATLEQYGEWQDLESLQMLAEYLARPDKWHRHHYRYANSVILRITLGERLSVSNKRLGDLQTVSQEFTSTIGRSIFDWFPSLAKVVPGIFWQPHWRAMGDRHNAIYRSWWDPVKEAIANGTAAPSFVRDTLLHPDTKFTGTDQDAMYLAMQVIGAGSDTTREALNIFTMAALEFPEVMAKGRAEVDRVCTNPDGSPRMPQLADMEDIRYICAMVKEVLRWRPIFVTTPDHTSDKDIEFEGFFFPKGTSFVVNEVAVGRECEDPDDFRPERWLDGHEMEVAHGLWQFGGGRRICVGYRLAQRSLFLVLSRLLQSFDFKANGPYNSRRLNHESLDEPFPVKVNVRSDAHYKMIFDAANTAGVWEFATQAS